VLSAAGLRAAGMAGILSEMLLKEPTAVQLRVTIADIEPPIWRRMLVPWTWNLGQLHPVIQAALGWWDYHLHQFVIGGLRYGDVEQIGEPEFEATPEVSTRQRCGCWTSATTLR
jgi:hypothetical protein